jgi:hypothetical protein
MLAAQALTGIDYAPAVPGRLATSLVSYNYNGPGRARYLSLNMYNIFCSEYLTKNSHSSEVRCCTINDETVPDPARTDIPSHAGLPKVRVIRTTVAIW